MARVRLFIVLAVLAGLMAAPLTAIASDRGPTDTRVTDEVDRVSDRVTDHRPIERCLNAADNPRRCLHDRPDDDINVRHLIWRLIKAQEWEKLFRLLHRLGLI